MTRKPITMDPIENSFKRGALLALVAVSSHAATVEEWYRALGVSQTEDYEKRWLREVCDWASLRTNVALANSAVGLVRIEG
jgi:hypothetical protein